MVMRIMLIMANIVLNHHFRLGAHSVYEIYSVFKLFGFCSLVWTFWLFRNFYSGDAHHANYGKHSLNHHFRHGANSVYQIYNVFKLPTEVNQKWILKGLSVLIDKWAFCHSCFGVSTLRTSRWAGN